MGVFDFLSKQESLLGVDVGLSGIKLVELDLSADRPRLVNIAHAELPSDVFSNNLIVKSDCVSRELTMLIEANGISERRAAVAMPGPSVFTKRIKVAKVPIEELADNVLLEAGNLIPYSADAVKIDFHILRNIGRSQVEVLIVAVKNEIIASFVDTLSLVGIETAVVDVDYFALQNCLENSYPELTSETVCVIDIGSRYSSLNICRGGETLFTGDIAVGGRGCTEALANGLGVSFDEAESLKRKAGDEEVFSRVADHLKPKVEQVSAELNRQLSLFWNASGAEGGIDKIFLVGGGGRLRGLAEELGDKTGVPCEAFDPFRGITCDQGIDPQYLRGLSPLMAVSVGLALRQPGDNDKEYRDD